MDREVNETMTALAEPAVWTPNWGGQADFAFDDVHRYVALGGGWGSGKTWIGARKLIGLHAHIDFDDGGQPSQDRRVNNCRWAFVGRGLRASPSPRRCETGWGDINHGLRDAGAARRHRSTRGYNPRPLRGQFCGGRDTQLGRTGQLRLR